MTDVLRGDRRRRPVADRSVAAALRTSLDETARALAERAPRARELTVRPGDLRLDRPADPNALARLRGALVHELLRLEVAGHRSIDHFNDALAAWRSEHDEPDALENLDEEERARLATEIVAHGVTLQRRLDAINPLWRPRTSVRAIQRIGDGVVVLRDVVDLVVGSLDSARAGVALFDLTTSPLNGDHERILRYHALVETLRSGVAPLRVATMSTATGELWSFDADRALLHRAHDELVDTVTRRWDRE